MTTHATFPSRKLPLIQVGLGLAALCLAVQVHAQAVEPVTDAATVVPMVGGGGAATSDRADKGGARSAPRRREAVSRGPVQARHYPSSPLPPVPAPPSKR